MNLYIVHLYRKNYYTTDDGKMIHIGGNAMEALVAGQDEDDVMSMLNGYSWVKWNFAKDDYSITKIGTAVERLDPGILLCDLHPVGR